ncbi:MAG: hypothetical protein ACLSFT_03105 [Ruminococcus callidus]
MIGVVGYSIAKPILNTPVLPVSRSRRRNFTGSHRSGNSGDLHRGRNTAGSCHLHTGCSRRIAVRGLSALRRHWKTAPLSAAMQTARNAVPAGTCW